MKTTGQLPFELRGKTRSSDTLPLAPLRKDIRPKLRRVALDADGFDNGGCHWPGDLRVYQASWWQFKWEGCVGNLSILTDHRFHYFRAVDDDAARQQVLTWFPLAHYPTCKFLCNNENKTVW